MLIAPFDTQLCVSNDTFTDDAQKLPKLAKCSALSAKTSRSYIAKGAESWCGGKVEKVTRNGTMLTFSAHNPR